MSLLGKFALLSAIPITLLGLLLGRTVGGSMREQVLAGATRSAELVARLGIQPLLRPEDLSRGLDGKRFKALDDILRSGLIGSEIPRIKIWNAEGTVIYSDESEIVGQTFPLSEDLHEALEGKLSSEITSLEEEEHQTERQYGRLLEVYVPIRFDEGAEPVGAFELYFPYLPIEQAIDQVTGRQYLVLLGGLLVLYATLFPIVAGAAKRLRQQAEENAKLALRDPLTDLPNRLLFRERVEQAVRSAKRTGASLAVMILDLDRFKEINNTLGHQTGDLLLQQVGPRLRDSLRDADTVARLGGDEFGILLPELIHGNEAPQVAAKILSALDRPFTFPKVALEVEASVGIATFPEHGDEVDVLLRHADVAMYGAKEARSGYQLYSEDRDRYSPDRLTLLGELRHAISQGQLVLHYQPKAEVRSGRVTGVEALARWQHPTRGLLAPDEFIPLAEPTALIGPLTRSVLEQALDQQRAWRRSGIHMPMAVNLSVRNLHDPSLPDKVLDLLEAHGAQPSDLVLEITETAIMEEPLRAAEVLRRLSAIGVGLAIDDFGIGQTSLAYLKRLPVHELKIDRSFVIGMTDEENNEVIVRSTIDLGRNLGLRVVAEGVETEAVWARLDRLGCEVAQGFYLRRPVPAEDLTPWLRDRTRLQLGRPAV